MKRVIASARMVGREVARNRVAIVLLFLVPSVLYTLIYATTGERLIPYQLGGAEGDVRAASEREISLLFMGSTAMCGLLAFLAFVLTWRPIQTDRRLVFEGYRPWELLGAKMLVVCAVAALVAIYVTVLLLFFYQPQRPAGVFVGFLLAGLLYGFIGMVLGTLSRSDLAGILSILLLVNVDPGWLQNPVFYASARNRSIIDWLPAHYPCQLTMLSALTQGSLVREGLFSAAWLAAIGTLAALLYRWRIGIVRRWPG